MKVICQKLYPSKKNSREYYASKGKGIGEEAGLCFIAYKGVKRLFG